MQILPGIDVYDDALPAGPREAITQFIGNTRWHPGWKSNPLRDQFSFFHAHFAGSLKPDHDGTLQHWCENELIPMPALADMWHALRMHYLPDHRLVRCYANAMPYGCDGTAHTDSINPDSCTVVYYPAAEWRVNWAGETVFFNPEWSDVLAAVYPKPNRLCVFRGIIPHAARGVTRSCPQMRVTLMFKTVAP